MVAAVWRKFVYFTDSSIDINIITSLSNKTGSVYLDSLMSINVSVLLAGKI